MYTQVSKSEVYSMYPKRLNVSYVYTNCTSHTVQNVYIILFVLFVCVLSYYNLYYYYYYCTPLILLQYIYLCQYIYTVPTSRAV